MRKYEKDIREWTLDFAIQMIKLSRELKQQRIDFDITDQIRRSGTSVGANVREAKSCFTKREMARYYAIALKSANETDYWFEILEHGYGYKSEAAVKCREELKQIEKIIATIVLKLRESA